MLTLVKLVRISPLVDDLGGEIDTIILDASDEMIFGPVYGDQRLQYNLILAGYFSTTQELIFARLVLKMVGHLIVIRFDDAW